MNKDTLTTITLATATGAFVLVALADYGRDKKMERLLDTIEGSSGCTTSQNFVDNIKAGQAIAIIDNECVILEP